MTTKSYSLAGSVFVLAALAALPERGWLRPVIPTGVKAWIDQISGNIEENQTDEHLIAKIRVNLRDVETQCKRARAELSTREVQSKDAVSQLAELKNELADEKKILADEKECLDRGEPTVVIAGREYLLGEVAASARARLDHVQQLQERAKVYEQLVEAISGAVDDSRASLLDAERAREQLLGELFTLELRLKSAACRAQVKEWIAALRRSDPLYSAVQTELSHNMTLLRQRVQAKEESAADGRPKAIINWKPSQTKSTESATDVARRIGDYLGKE